MHTNRILRLVLVAILFLTACGSGGSSADGENTTAPTGGDTTLAETTTTAAPTTTAEPTTTTTAPTTTTTEAPPDAQALWQVYREYFDAVTVGEWDAAAAVSTGTAAAYVEMSREFQNVTDQTGWVFDSDTGPAGDPVTLDDGRIAVGGATTYLKEGVGSLTPYDPIFDTSGSDPLLSSWGSNLTEDQGENGIMDNRLLTLGEADDECAFEPLHAYDPLPHEPMELILVSIQVCPDSAWLPAEDAVTVTEADGVTTGSPSLFWPGAPEPIPAAEPTVIVVSFRIEERALSAPITFAIETSDGAESVSLPPFRGG